jgi:hypothetical protein
VRRWDCSFGPALSVIAIAVSWHTDSISNKLMSGVINHVHLWDLFGGDAGSDDDLLLLAKVLAVTWKCAAETQFPTKQFIGEWRSDDSDYGPTVYIYGRPE